ncbi:hypothetical protein BESB_028740 [Besnoitia besnoiti]|uniref:RanBP2-type domain-containing protein n=1 Tax=Besnoitia besnoiti TaxID=94643 RepID=A0A2A9M0G1_BESBE|nr:uncharacterized protein BESB_028740 [Besnoitia besnoiti]PFH31439.1 hypothetical protein BESB_028740 [Besnoitia besnoiti]
MKSTKRSHCYKSHKHEEKHKKSKLKRRKRSHSSSSSSSASPSPSPVLRHRGRVKVLSSPVRRADDREALNAALLATASPRAPVAAPDLRRSGRADGRRQHAEGVPERRRRRSSSDGDHQVVSFVYNRPTVGPTGAYEEEEQGSATSGHVSLVAKVAAASLQNSSPSSQGAGDRERKRSRHRLADDDDWAQQRPKKKSNFSGFSDAGPSVGGGGRTGEKRRSNFSSKAGEEDASSVSASAYEVKTYHKAFGLDVGGYSFVGEEEVLQSPRAQRGDKGEMKDAVKAGAAASLLHGPLVEVTGTNPRGGRISKKTHPHLYWQCWSCGADNYKSRHQCFKCNRLFAL